MADSKVPDFRDWISQTAPNWIWNWKHQIYLYDKLDMITNGKTKRLMVFMPPRHSKSETVTVRYTAWRMVREPNSNIILGCYNQRLANRFSRKVRRIVGDSIPLSKERKAADEWETLDGGGLCAVGVGAGVTGFGANLIVIDDPVKNRSEAESKAYRENTWDWFNDDIFTRLEPNAAIILIQTRWHEDDLAGRLLNEMKNGGEQWEVVSLPALAGRSGDTPVPMSPEGDRISTIPDHRFRTRCVRGDKSVAAPSDDPLGREPGEALCPDRYDETALRRIEKKLGSYSFAALYQQNPVPLDGGIFKRAWFERIVDKAPPKLKWFRGYDLAVSTKTTADFTASFRIASDDCGNIYIANGMRSRIEYPEQRRYVIERMRAEKDTVHGIESALHGQALVQDINRDTKLFRVVLRAIRADKDKVARALPWAAKAEAGKVILVRGAWNEAFIEEVCSFPNGTHDDQVDAVSLAFRMMTEQTKRSTGF
ncbi:MAG: phage terminase large subunit [Pyrinomonadaceae bacterium]